MKDPLREADELLEWLGTYTGKFLRKNGDKAAAVAIELAGVKLAMATIPGNKATLPAPLLIEYRKHFGYWKQLRMTRFTLRITLRLCTRPDGPAIFQIFARQVLQEEGIAEVERWIDEYAY